MTPPAAMASPPALTLARVLAIVAVAVLAPAAQAMAPVAVTPTLTYPGDAAAPELPTRGCGLFGCTPAR